MTVAEAPPDAIAELRAAFLKLGAGEPPAEWLSILQLMGRPVAPSAALAFQPARRSVVEAELQKLAKLAEELASKLQALHRPVIDALANAGFLRDKEFLKHLEKLGRAAKSADISQVSENNVGRPSKPQGKVVAATLASFYVTLIGKQLPAARSHGVLKKKAVLWPGL